MEHSAYATAMEIRASIVGKEVSATEVMAETISRMESLEPMLNAFVTTTPEQAMEAARAADRLLAEGGEPGPLHGVPISVKDLINVGGVRTTFGSRTMADNVVEDDAPSVDRARAAGACIIGKTTTTEFGCKAGGGDSPLSGITRNAWDPSKTTGGSSAGAATSVAAGVTPFALGTDGGGSIRIPASFCGVFGIKAQFGRVPVFPTSATPTLAHVGWRSRPPTRRPMPGGATATVCWSRARTRACGAHPATSTSWSCRWSRSTPRSSASAWARAAISGTTPP